MYEAPYRARPLTWKYNDVDYHNEKAVVTQQTGWNFITLGLVSGNRQIF